MTAHPISPYSIGKYSGELYAQMHMRHLQKPIKILRPFNVFGETQSNKAEKKSTSIFSKIKSLASKKSK